MRYIDEAGDVTPEQFEKVLADVKERLERCTQSSCHRHGRCMYLNHPRGCKR